MVPCEVAKSSVGSFADTDPVRTRNLPKSPVQHCVNPKRDTMDRSAMRSIHMPKLRES
jgi:hypothetical protein